MSELDYKCPKCGNTLDEERELDYPFVCHNCDENFYEFEAVSDSIDCKLMHFVHNELQACIKAAIPDVSSLRYVERVTETNPFGNDRYFEQAVIIVFNNGYRKIANVHMDSPWGAIKDVMKTIER